MLRDNKAFSGFSAEDIATAKEFYAGTLGWKFRNLRACSRRTSPVATKPDLSKATLLNFPVKDVDLAVDELKKRGLPFEQHDLPDLKTDAKGSMRGNGATNCAVQRSGHNILFDR
jgi:hypothetical protein